MSQDFELKSRVYLLVKYFPESDDRGFIQMSFISTDLEVKGVTERLFEQLRPSNLGQRRNNDQSTAIDNVAWSLQLKLERPTSEH